jgi:2-methylisocitrate lyase-like PEP mutase family enzyme
MRSQAAALKAVLDEPRLQVMPGCGDGMGARLIEEAGFRTGFVSGSSVSAMRLAMPDMDLVSFNEMADAVESCIAAAPNVLWLADGDTGHGNALAVQRVVRAYARRGAAAVLIEDQDLAASARPRRREAGGRARACDPALPGGGRGLPR